MAESFQVSKHHNLPGISYFLSRVSMDWGMVAANQAKKLNIRWRPATYFFFSLVSRARSPKAIPFGNFDFWSFFRFTSPLRIFGAFFFSFLLDPAI